MAKTTYGYRLGFSVDGEHFTPVRESTMDSDSTSAVEVAQGLMVRVLTSGKTDPGSVRMLGSRYMRAAAWSTKPGSQESAALIVDQWTVNGIIQQPPAIPAPTLSTVAPATCKQSDKPKITLTGTGMSVSGLAAQIGANALTGVTATDDTKATGTAPVMDVGTYDVTVSTDAGLAVIKGGFKVTADDPPK